MEKIQQVREYLSVRYHNIAKNYMGKAKEEARKGDPFRTNARNYSLISIIFSALTLESSINDIGISCLGEEFFREIDRLNLCQKYIIIARLLSKEGKTFDKCEPSYRKLKELNSLRNKLVHYKSYKETSEGETLETDIEKKVRPEKAEYFLKAIKEILQRFQQITGIPLQYTPVLLKIEVEKPMYSSSTRN